MRLVIPGDHVLKVVWSKLKTSWRWGLTVFYMAMLGRLYVFTYSVCPAFSGLSLHWLSSFSSPYRLSVKVFLGTISRVFFLATTKAIFRVARLIHHSLDAVSRQCSLLQQ
jgi:hypothetical protein